MSDPLKSSGFPRYLKLALMGLAGVIIAGLGAVATLSLRNPKISVHEENHAVAQENTQAAHATEIPALSVQDSQEHRDADDSKADPFSPEALGFTESEPRLDNDGQDVQPGVDADTSAAGADKSLTNERLAAARNLDRSLSSPEPDGTGRNAGEVAFRPQSREPRISVQDPLPSLPTTDDYAQQAAQQETITKQAVNLMASADEQLLSGSYALAMRAYQSLRQKSEGPPGVAILFRLALCAEAAGRHAAAIEAYRKVSGTQADPAWSGVARYGEARCLAAVRRHDGLQTDLLRRAVLDETEFLPTVRSEVLHLIGRDLWREQSTMKTVDLLDDRTLIVPEWVADPARLLDELSLLVHETPVIAEPVSFHVLHSDDATPDGVSVQLSCGMTRIDSLLKNLVTGCRLSFDISEQATELLQGRSQQVHVAARSLAVLLDGLTIPFDLAWRLQDSSVQIMHRNQLTEEDFRQSRLNAAERLLRIAVMEGANSPQVGHSRLALGTLLYEQKRVADAIQFLQVQIETAPRSVVETEAAFNLGKCLMELHRRDDARGAFLRSIDASGGLIDVKIASYIFNSRLLLEDQQGKLAISTMMRGLALSKGSEMEPWAALQLGSAYLILDNPQGANSVLMERREELAAGPSRAGAAFVSALARFRAAVLSDRREREGWAVVSALSEFRSEDYCGGHWAVLAAGACDELGLSQQSTEAFEMALKTLPPCALRSQTMLRLASHYQADNQYEEARLLLTSLTSSEANQLTLQAELRTAEVALAQNHPDAAILTCRHLIDSSDIPQIERAALKIMGQAYERQQNHHAAIYCFAGMLPDDETALDVPHEPALPAANGAHTP